MKKLVFFSIIISLCFLVVSCNTYTSNDSAKIIIPNDYDFYIGNNYDINTLVDHFSELGFVNIETIPQDPDNETYDKNIFRIEILYSGWKPGEAWTAGDHLHSDDTLKIHYNARPLLTVENSPELLTYLTTKEINCVEFAEKYDDYYVELDAYVTYYQNWDGVHPIIKVTAGDYDGTIELGHSDNSLLSISYINIGDNTWNPNIDYSVEEGENVKVVGYIMSGKTAYYEELYVETILLQKR